MVQEKVLIKQYLESLVASLQDGLPVEYVFQAQALSPLINPDERVRINPAKKITDYKPGDIILAKPTNDISKNQSYLGLYVVHTILVHTLINEPRRTLLWVGGISYPHSHTSNPLGTVTHVVAGDGTCYSLSERLYQARWTPMQTLPRTQHPFI